MAFPQIQINTSTGHPAFSTRFSSGHLYRPRGLPIGVGQGCFAFSTRFPSNGLYGMDGSTR